MDPDPRVHKDKSLDLSGRSIQVIVGSEPPVTFSVHENLVCASSRFFKKALSGDWKEAEDGRVRLEGDSPDVFEIYLHWLYRRTLPVRIDSPGHEGNFEYLQLAKAYVLGDMLQADTFRDAAIDAIIKKATTKALDGATWFPVGNVIRYIYDNTVDTSKARRLLVDLYTHHGHGNWLCEWADAEDLPKEFLLELAVSLLDKRSSPNRAFVSGISTCEYHEHSQGECHTATTPKKP
ncbi:hypothetical protein PT974_08142 [Cladobotryum mycophilum]|uniref:BTB domain-containing protein n=1 Tax=Cladobotryum mycophilum TaxID=491253 RepID=A0ABR0SDK9_9HYPO